MGLENQLKEIRLKRGLTKADMAKMLNLPYTTYNNYEIGTREANSETLIKMSKTFGVTIDYLLGRVNEPNNIFNLNDLSLSKEERALIIKLRSYDDRQKRKVYELVDDIDLYIQTQQKLEEMTKELKFYKENYVTEAKMIAFGGERESVKITPEKRKKLQEILNREEDGDDIIPD